ncbi:hypothetical protein RE474_07130 [Methanolobus sediminis]|uniref:Uncharacterized protein n=1 Tax=Methanolobus sediminis TaxID=3072978 RepID=A0AA51YKF6_9EURY|nr:hypothetical protein [Methanolobus sediminis]WMW23877.1 hypothetical protein RE474_07130 [Methanolobus sediminis]
MTPVSFKEKMSVDKIGDLRLPIILIFPMVLLFIMAVIGLDILAFNIVYFLIWYLCLAIIVLQDITTVEIESNKIIIHRFVLSPTTINMDDIKTIKGRNNIPRKYHILFTFIMLVLIAGMLYFAYSNIQRSFTGNISSEEGILLVLSNSMMIIFYLIIYFNAEKRIRYPAFLEVITNKEKFRFYTHKPIEFRDLILNESNK